MKRIVSPGPRDISVRILLVNSDGQESENIEAFLEQDMRVPWSIMRFAHVADAQNAAAGADIVILKTESEEASKAKVFADMNAMVFETPIIVLANAHERAHALSTFLMEKGAADMVVRGQFARLVDAIEFAIIRQKIMTRTRKSSEAAVIQGHEAANDHAPETPERMGAELAFERERHQQILRMLTGAYAVDQMH